MSGGEQGLVNTKESMAEVPLEQEVAKMKREKMPIRGGATPIYGDENGDVMPECDYRVGRLERARMEMSRVVQERMSQDEVSQIKTQEELQASGD